VVINTIDIPGAFTKAGWSVMQENLAKADKFFGGERWVLGDYALRSPLLQNSKRNCAAAIPPNTSRIGASSCATAGSPLRWPQGCG